MCKANKVERERQGPLHQSTRHKETHERKDTISLSKPLKVKTQVARLGRKGGKTMSQHANLARIAERKKSRR